MAPSYVILGVLNVILLFMSYTITMEALRQRADAAEAEAASTQEREEKVDGTTTGQMIVGAILLVLTVAGNVVRKRYHSCQEAGDCNHFPLLLLGDGLAPKEGKPVDWTWALLMYFPVWLCMVLGTACGMHAHAHKGWSIGKAASFSVVGWLTGVVGALVGVGGGLIFCPFFVISGMDPAVAIGTSSLCVLFTATSTTFSYLLTDRIISSLALVLGIAVAPTSIVAAYLVQHMQTNPGMKSTMVLILAAAIIASLVCSTIKFGMEIQQIQ
jgi:hypothetical protein